MTITAKYRSTCRICEGVILPGDRIEWTRGSRIVTHAACSEGVRRATSSEPSQDDGEADDQLIGDDEPARRARYDGRSRVSNVTTFSSGATIYTNKRGRCEDAPCCGCCS